MNYPPYYQPNYQPYAPPMMDQLAQLRAQQPAPNPMIWVQGEAAAKSYLVAAGNTVPLWDSENMCIYVKSVDASGVPSMRHPRLHPSAPNPHRRSRHRNTSPVRN